MKNRERIEAMYRLGYTQGQIAEKLGVSRRTVIRATASLPRMRNNQIIEEAAVMASLRELGYSFAEIGYQTGQSKQSVYQKIGA